MTEQKWLTSVAVIKMTLFVASHDGMARRKIGRRKLRLFGCFSCRQLWEQMTDARSRHAVEVAERLADDRATPAEVKQAVEDAHLVCLAVVSRAPQSGNAYQRAAEARGWLPDDERDAARSARSVLSGVWRSFTCRNLFYEGSDSELARTLSPARRRTQADGLRCIFGNPFRPVEVDPAWLTWNEGTVRRVARSIYDERAWDQMPILGDALEDAGCTRERVLSHCREPGPHTRGCWVVDLLLGLALSAPPPKRPRSADRTSLRGGLSTDAPSADHH